jgi:hypothetical protein
VLDVWMRAGVATDESEFMDEICGRL